MRYMCCRMHDTWVTFTMLVIVYRSSAGEGQIRNLTQRPWMSQDPALCARIVLQDGAYAPAQREGHIYRTKVQKRKESLVFSCADTYITLLS